jgi:hypothetical protein
LRGGRSVIYSTDSPTKMGRDFVGGTIHHLLECRAFLARAVQSNSADERAGHLKKAAEEDDLFSKNLFPGHACVDKVKAVRDKTVADWKEIESDWASLQKQ